MAPFAAGGETIDAGDAVAHVGSATTVEGDVTVARVDPEGLVLELGAAGPQSFRAVLLLPLFSSLPRSPERIYAGKRVRVTGVIRKFHGRPEMVLGSPGQIEVIDLAGAPVASTTTTTVPPASGASVPAPVAPPPATSVPPEAAPRTANPIPTPAPPPAPAAAAAGPAVSTARSTAATPPAEAPPKPLLHERLAAVACDRARDRWRTAATRTREASEALTRCLDGGGFACRTVAAQLAPAVTDLEWAEQQVADRCD